MPAISRRCTPSMSGISACRSASAPSSISWRETCGCSLRAVTGRRTVLAANPLKSHVKRTARPGDPPPTMSSLMENRQLGASGFMVPVLSLGTGTFGGGGELFKHWGATDVKEATRIVDICLEAGLTMFDSADVYSGGMAEEI